MESSVTNKNLIKSIYICDKCGQSEMSPTGKVFLSNPPIYEHECKVCGTIKEFNKCYPTMSIVTDDFYEKDRKAR